MVSMEIGMRTNTHLYYESFSAFKAQQKPLLKQELQNPLTIFFTFQFKEWNKFPTKERNSLNTHDSPPLSLPETPPRISGKTVGTHHEKGNLYV